MGYSTIEVGYHPAFLSCLIVNIACIDKKVPSFTLLLRGGESKLRVKQVVELGWPRAMARIFPSNIWNTKTEDLEGWWR